MHAINRFKKLDQDNPATPLCVLPDTSSSERRGVLKLYHNGSGDSCLATATIIGPEGIFTHGFFADPAGEKDKPGFAERACDYLRHHNIALVGIFEDVEFVLNAFCDTCGNLRHADPEGVDFSKE